jgi:hypothetical protein
VLLPALLEDVPFGLLNGVEHLIRHLERLATLPCQLAQNPLLVWLSANQDILASHRCASEQIQDSLQAGTVMPYWIAAKFLDYLPIFTLDLIHLQTCLNAQALFEA